MKNQEAKPEEAQKLTSGQACSTKVAVAAMHPKVEEDAQRLQGVTRLTMLEQSGGRTCGWRREEQQAEAHRVREIGQPTRKLKIQPN